MPKVFLPVSATGPDLETVPQRVDRATGAALVTRFFFPTTARALENWDLEWLIVAGKATCPTAALFAAAQAKLDTARPARSARTRTAEPAAA